MAIMQINKYDITKIISDIYNEHPYKVVGQPDTYSQYNEGWCDACDRIEAVLVAVISGQTEQVCTIDKIDCCGYKGGKCVSIENCYGKVEKPVIQ